MLRQKSVCFKHGVVLAGLWLCLFLPAAAQTNMTVRRNVHRDVSPPLRDLMLHAPRPSLVKREAEPARRIPLPQGLVPLQEDPVRQRTAAMVPFTPVVGTSFEGLGAGQYGFTITGAPPDTNGTVGATQYVQWVNESFAVFNKVTGAVENLKPILGGEL